MPDNLAWLADSDGFWGFAGLAGFGFSWLNHSANNCVKLTKTLVTIWGF